jgi:hypothetical protein
VNTEAGETRHEEEIMRRMMVCALSWLLFSASVFAQDFDTWANRVLRNPQYSGYTRAELREHWNNHYGISTPSVTDDAPLVIDAGKYLMGILAVEEVKKEWCSSYPPFGRRVEHRAEEARIAFILRNRTSIKQELEAQRAMMQRRAASLVRELMPPIVKAAPSLASACLYMYGMLDGLAADAGRRLEAAEKERK